MSDSFLSIGNPGISQQPDRFVTSVLRDASVQLEMLTGISLFYYLRALPWKKYLTQHLRSLSERETINLFTGLAFVVAQYIDEGKVMAHLSFETEQGDTVDPVEKIRRLYILQFPYGRSKADVIGNVHRTWSARLDNAMGRVAVGTVLDPIFIKESRLEDIKDTGKVLACLGLKCTENGVNKGQPFYAVGIKRRDITKRLVAFWEACVPATCLNGLVGRYYGEAVGDRILKFKEEWNEQLLEDLEPAEMKYLASFLAYSDYPPPLSAEASKISLTRMLRSAPRDDASDPDSSRSEVLVKEAEGEKDIQARNQKLKQMVYEEESSSDESSSLVSKDGIWEDRFVPKGRRLSFIGLSRKMKEILRMRGPEFQENFEPLQLEVTTSRELLKLLRYYREGQQLTMKLCRVKQLNTKPEDCVEELETTPVYIVKPEHRMHFDLYIPATDRIAPREISRWMLYGPISAWVEHLAQKAGNVQKNNAGGYLAREILSVGLTLAALLDEFHPSRIVYSVAVERLARRLLVVEVALTKDPKERGAYFKEKLVFMGLERKTDYSLA